MYIWQYLSICLTINMGNIDTYYSFLKELENKYNKHLGQSNSIPNDLRNYFIEKLFSKHIYDASDTSTLYLSIFSIDTLLYLEEYPTSCNLDLMFITSYFIAIKYHEDFYETIESFAQCFGYYKDTHVLGQCF